MNDFTILIATKNRPHDIKFTIESLVQLLEVGYKLLVFDDASLEKVSDLGIPLHPNITFYQTDEPVGYLQARNFLMKKVETPYAIVLDDDANFLLLDKVHSISKHFEDNPKCGVVAFRIFWGLEQPKSFESMDNIQRVKSFVGCGHAWRMTAWKNIPDYPNWYKFYGEEEFASLHLLKNKIEVHYLPDILIQHRVDNKGRREKADYTMRIRRSLSAGWYNYFLFLPPKVLPGKLSYSIIQFIIRKVFYGRIMNIKILYLVIKDVLKNIGNIRRSRSAISNLEYEEYKYLQSAKIFWNPDTEI